MEKPKLWLSLEDRELLDRALTQVKLEDFVTPRDVEGAAKAPPDDEGFWLSCHEGAWQLSALEEPSWNPLVVDFLSEDWKFRAKRTWNSKELLRDALGVKRGEKLKIMDGTAGLGADAFMMSLWGHEVIAYERHPVLAFMLMNAIERSREHYSELEGVGTVGAVGTEANVGEIALVEPDVLYLDPIYPEKKKSALNRKELRIVKKLVGIAELSDEALSEYILDSLPHVKKRIVVKRPTWSPRLPWKRGSPRMAEGKTTRFEIFDRILL